MGIKRPSEENSLREQFAWTYGHLAMAHRACEEGATSYSRGHYAIRMKFRQGYLKGTMKMRGIDDDEKTKMRYGTRCSYCGAEEKLTIDHLIPKMRGGAYTADNITYACRSCNSSKGKKDMMAWCEEKGEFPALLVFRRYLKLSAGWAQSAGLMEVPWNLIESDNRPLRKESVRPTWPAIEKLKLYPERANERSA